MHSKLMSTTHFLASTVQEKAEQLLPEEPFVDDYLERIYPTSYQTCRPL